VLKISVIVPSYNQGSFLEETLLSIFEQNYPSLEVFVMDGGSTDNSVEIIKKYEDRITGWVSEKDKGQSHAINKGFQLATGDIVSWLCSDDLYTPDALEKVNEVFSTLPHSTGVLHGDSILFRNDKQVRFDTGYLDLTLERQLAGMGFPQPSSFMRRSCLEKAGLLNEKFHFGMDYDLFSRMIMVCDFHYCNFLFSRYRLHDASKSTIAVSKFLAEWSIIFNSIAEGLNLVEIKDALAKQGLNTQTDDSIVKFFSQQKLKRPLDIKKMLYYFFSHVITYDYATNNFQRVRKIGTMLKKEFPDFLALEPKTLKVIHRSLILPPFLLRFARSIKHSLVKE
jgi:glycosyltransferase involved in cell wall biosynthesis